MAKSTQQPSSVQLYRDSALYLQTLIKYIVSTPHLIQNSIGVEAIKESAQISQLIMKAYKKYKEEKLAHLNQMLDIIYNEQVVVNQLFELSYIKEKAKAHLFQLLGSMETQAKAWKNSITKMNKPMQAYTR